MGASDSAPRVRPTHEHAMLVRHLPALAALPLLLAAPAPVALDTDYEADVEFALEALEERCGHFFDLKDIDWKKVTKQFEKEAKKVETDQEHLVLLVRLHLDGEVDLERARRGRAS